jgi:mannose-6-phosphate isomerase
MRVFRRKQDADPAAEDWLSSDITPRSARAGSQEGLGKVYDDSAPFPALLRDLIVDDPSFFLGVEATRTGASRIGVLAKLLCPDRRIPIHCHPTRTFATKYLNSAVGKTEAWLVLEAAGDGPNAWIGFRRSITAEKWRALIVRQDSAMLLDELQAFCLRAGDVAFVPAGTPHAVGPGILVLEPQEPSDWSILAEFESFGLDVAVATLTLGLDRAVGSYTYQFNTAADGEAAYVRRQLLNRLTEGCTPVLRGEGADYFKVTAVRAIQPCAIAATGCWVAVVANGSGGLESNGVTVPCSSGDAFFIPAAANPVRAVSPDGELLLLTVAPPT